MFDFLQYEFMQNAYISGIVIAILWPLVWVFLIIRRYTMISDTLSHASLTWVMISLLSGISPLLGTLLYSIFSALIIEKLRLTKRFSWDMLLSVFLSLNLAIVATMVSLDNWLILNISSYLFWSISLVSRWDVYLILFVWIFIFTVLFFMRDSLMKSTYDEDNAISSGINTKLINMIFIIIVAMLISLAIPITWILLLSALIILPVVVSSQISWSFKSTVIIAEIISVFSVISGITISYFYDISASGMITFILIAFFIVFLVYNQINQYMKK